MDLTDLANSLAKQFITDNNRDGQIDIGEAIGTLFSGAGSSLDLAGIISSMQGSGLSDIAASWLGDGENQPISGAQITEIFGSDKMNDFASSMNMDVGSAEDGLAKIVPELIDKSSSAGQLMDLVNAAGGLSGLSENLFKMFSKK